MVKAMESMTLTNEQKSEQKMWGEFYAVLRIEAKEIRLELLRQKLAKTTAELEDKANCVDVETERT